MAPCWDQGRMREAALTVYSVDSLHRTRKAVALAKMIDVGTQGVTREMQFLEGD